MSDDNLDSLLNMHNRHTDLINNLVDHKIRQVDENRKLSRRIEEIADFCYRNWKHNKQPHKCPVCDGSGRYKLATAQCNSDVIDCRSCEGTGIVWG